MATRSHRPRPVPALLALLVLLGVAAGAWWLRDRIAAPPTSEAPAVAAPSEPQPAVEAAQLPSVPASRRLAPREGPREAEPVTDVAARPTGAQPEEELPRDARFWRETADIEDFKRAVYALEIDTIDDIPKLEALVHVEVEDPLELWDTDWAGVDDWKRYQDGFSLERGPDGSLLFHPGEETQRMFTFFEGISLYEWDESNGAFVNQVDYYGKPIYNVVKFLREDVLVMMTISGHKVDTNIFQQGDYR